MIAAPLAGFLTDKNEQYGTRIFEKDPKVSANLCLTKRLEGEIGRLWHGEESKQQSPRSLNSSLHLPGLEKAANQSFQINDSTDGLLENPLTSVIKEY